KRKRRKRRKRIGRVALPSPASRRRCRGSGKMSSPALPVLPAGARGGECDRECGAHRGTAPAGGRGIQCPACLKLVKEEEEESEGAGAGAREGEGVRTVAR